MDWIGVFQSLFIPFLLVSVEEVVMDILATNQDFVFEKWKENWKKVHLCELNATYIRFQCYQNPIYWTM